MKSKTRRRAGPVRVVVWDLYPAFPPAGAFGVKRNGYTWAAGVRWESIRRWLWDQHGNTDLRYTVMQRGKVVREGTFLGWLD